MLRRIVPILLSLGFLVLSHPVRAAIVFSFSTGGIVFPTDPATCPDPFAGCSMTAVGAATATTANVSPLPGPWAFSATFAIVAPLSPTTFRTTGAFAFDDTSAANDDFSGLLDGVLDVTTFANDMTYVVTSSSGQFAGRQGFGSSVIQIIPQGPNQPFAFVETGAFTIPEPGTLALLGVAALVASRRRTR